jgi:hypothetical protein
MEWHIYDSMHGGTETTLDRLRDEYPYLVAFDSSGYELDIDELDDDPVELARSAEHVFLGTPESTIKFWPDAESSKNDDGANVVAIATWE